jgi:polyvinyl alcohol dehydrogenase (cytochrome)
MGGQNLTDTRYQSSGATISPANVGQLAVKWSFATGGGVGSTPAVVNGVVYFPDKAGKFYALNANTGAIIWSHKISDWTGVPGDWVHDDPAIDGNTLFMGDEGGQIATYSNGSVTGAGAKLIAVNTQTGQPIWVTQVGWMPFAAATSSPIVFNGIVYLGLSAPFEENRATSHPDYACCVFLGNVVAVKESTGKVLWRSLHMPVVPPDPGGYAGASVWGSTFVVDPARGSLYFGTGDNYAIPPEVEACIETAQAMGEPDSVCNGVDDYGEDYFDSIVAVDLNTGQFKWGTRFSDYDTWNGGCKLMLDTCPPIEGTDSDFSAGPNLFPTNINGTTVDVLGEGQKTGVYHAVNPDNGAVLWNTTLGPGLGGQQWGSATDGQRIYVPYGNVRQMSYELQTSGVTITSGAWNALDPATGTILWQTATPGTCRGPHGPSSCSAIGGATVANGVVYAGSMSTTPNDPTMFALNAATGQILWSFPSGLEVHSSPAIVGNSLYWGSGYEKNVRGTMYSFTPASNISLVQETTEHGGSVSELALGSITVSQGDLLVAHATVSGSGIGISSVSDNLGNPWTRVSMPCVNRTLDNEFWYTTNAAGGSTVVTLGLSSKNSSGISMNLSEWRGTLPTWSHDADSSCGSANSSILATDSVNTTGSNDLVLAGCSQVGFPVLSGGPTNGFATLISGGTGPFELIGYTISNGSNGPFQTSWTTAFAATSNACLITSFINSP